MALKRRIGRFLQKFMIKNLRNKLLFIVRRYSSSKFSILELGCGKTGSLDYEKIGKTISLTGADRDKSRLAEFSVRYKKLNPETRPLDLNKNPNSLGKYDLIVFGGVIHYLDNPKSTLKLIRNSLKKPGILIITTVNKDNLLRRIGLVSKLPKKHAGEKKFYSLFTLSKTLKTSGFEVIETAGSDFMPLPKALSSNIIAVCKK